MQLRQQRDVSWSGSRGTPTSAPRRAGGGSVNGSATPGSGTRRPDDIGAGHSAASPGARSQMTEAQLQSALSQSRLIAVASESTLKAQRSQLQLQLDIAAQREAILEARLIELQIKLTSDEIAETGEGGGEGDSDADRERLAVLLRRAREAEWYARKCAEDERIQRTSAETALSLLVVEKVVPRLDFSLQSVAAGAVLNQDSVAQFSANLAIPMPLSQCAGFPQAHLKPDPRPTICQCAGISPGAACDCKGTAELRQ